MRFVDGYISEPCHPVGLNALRVRLGRVIPCHWRLAVWFVRPRRPGTGRRLAVDFHHGFVGHGRSVVSSRVKIAEVVREDEPRF